MTIQGAIAELQNLLKVDDVPFYYKSGIEKVIETIQMDMTDRKTEATGYNLSPVEDKQTEEPLYTWQDEQEYNDRWQTERSE